MYCIHPSVPGPLHCSCCFCFFSSTRNAGTGAAASSAAHERARRKAPRRLTQTEAETRAPPHRTARLSRFPPPRPAYRIGIVSHSHTAARARCPSSRSVTLTTLLHSLHLLLSCMVHALSFRTRTHMYTYLLLCAAVQCNAMSVRIRTYVRVTICRRARAHVVYDVVVQRAAWEGLRRPRHACMHSPRHMDAFVIATYTCTLCYYIELN